jgi:DNA-binding transcriptional LysR family regulator
MDLRQLEMMRAVAESGSFTGAGERLHVSQSAISRQILLLEDELNEPLFLRRGRKVSITPAGEALVQLGQRVFADITETVRAITDRRGPLTGRLRVAGGMTVCMYVLPPVLREFRRAHPAVEIRLITGSMANILRELRTGTVDIALLTFPLPDSDFATLPALQEELLLVMRPDHPLARKARIAARDLAHEPFVLFEPASNTRRTTDAFFAKSEIDPPIVLETENVEILKALVRTGMGVSIIPYQAVAREVRAGQLACARITGAHLERSTGWVYLRATKVPRILDELFAAFNEVRPRLKLGPDEE